MEHLSARVWVLSVLPRLLRDRRGSGWGVATRCYAFDATRLGEAVARASARAAHTEVDRLGFRLLDVRDDDGVFTYERMLYCDLRDVQADVLEELEAGGWVPRSPAGGAFVAKSLAKVPVDDADTLWRALLLIRISVWKARSLNALVEDTLLFVARRPWWRAIVRYSDRLGLEVVSVRPRLRLRRVLRASLGPHWTEVGRNVRSHLYGAARVARDAWRGGLSGSPGEREADSRPPVAADPTGPSSARVALEYRSQLNLGHPERSSDLFFWQQSDLSGTDLVVTFGSPLDPLDEAKCAELAEHGMTPLVLHPKATTVTRAPSFTHRPRNSPSRGQGRSRGRPTGPEAGWVREREANYGVAVDYWRELFVRYGIKVFVSWYTGDPLLCAASEALASVGGITTVYQRSYQGLPFTASAAVADVMFGFSPAGADVQRASGSTIRYHVATGFIGDHRFALLEGEAAEVRRLLRARGAARVLSYFDENSIDEERWFFGHSATREDYAFLLQKVVDNPWLGVVLKPKFPGSLPTRLGPVADLLRRALDTGRCYMFEGRGPRGSYPPAVAAMASDVAIHGQLTAGTAGLEAALAGTPTVLMDRENWPLSPLSRLGRGRVVFRDWDDVWAALERHWDSPGGVDGFGDWSSMLDELDPFRDGRAAERMGCYVKWLIEGLVAGQDRDSVMASAAERYCARWGDHVVTELRPGAGIALPL